MKIVKKRFCDWDDTTKRKLRRATLRGGSLRSFTQAFHKSLTIVAFNNKQIMGWAFILCQTHNNKPQVNLFVNDRYKGHGLAGLLVERVLKNFEMISLAKWDKVTKRLFRRLQKENPGKVTVFDWWKHKGKYKRIVQEALHP